MEFTQEELDEIEAHGKSARNKMIKELKLNVTVNDKEVAVHDLPSYCTFATTKHVTSLFDTLKVDLSLATGLSGEELMSAMVQGLALNLAQASGYLDKVREVKSRPGRETAVEDGLSSLQSFLENVLEGIDLDKPEPKAKKPTKKKRKDK